jgi:phosphoglycolate phosphatase-like HAD superfamily hydrolase
MIGDAWSDLLAGQNANLRGVILVKTGRGTDQLQQIKPENLREYLVCNDLSSALEVVSIASQS